MSLMGKNATGKLAATDTTLVSVAHRAAVLKYHKQVLDSVVMVGSSYALWIAFALIISTGLSKDFEFICRCLLPDGH